MSSTHVVRKQGISDTAFNHQLHDELNDEIDNTISSDDEDAPETKNQYFEFSNSYYVMRFIKVIFLVQVISLLLDHPEIKIPIFFDVFCRGILTYSREFYSRPFLDFIYIIQYFWHNLLVLAQQQDVPTTPSNVEVDTPNSPVRRQLNINPYATTEEKPFNEHFGFDANFLDPHNWHTIKHYNHYFLTIVFTILSILFFLRFWEISDYSNRDEIKRWLDRYIADGWWRKGGFNVARVMGKSLLYLAAFLLVINAIVRSIAKEFVTNGLILSCMFVIFCAMIFMVWLCGFIGIRVTEAAFVRYVSQNVAYTSAIILKRAVKAKLDLGLMLVCAMFIPMVYSLLQVLLIFTDWNDTLASDHRVKSNYYVSCYFMAFPPFHRARPPEACPVIPYVSYEQQNIPGRDYYLDSNILQCDSYFGIAIYVITACCLTLGILLFFYMFYFLIHQVVTEFKASKWVDVLEKLIRIRDEEKLDYEQRFPWYSRSWISLGKEIRLQSKHYRIASLWLFVSIMSIFKSIVMGIFNLLKSIIRPFHFIISRILILVCINLSSFVMREDPRAKAQRDHWRSLSQKTKDHNQKVRSSKHGKGSSRKKSKSRLEVMNEQRQSMKSNDVILDENEHQDDSDYDGKENSFVMASSSFGGSTKSGIDDSGEDAAMSKKVKDNTMMNRAASSATVGGGVGIDDEYTQIPGSDSFKEDFTPFSISVKFQKTFAKLNKRVDPMVLLNRAVEAVGYFFKKKILQLTIVAYLRVKVAILIQYLFYKKYEDSRLAHGMASLGANPAPWRLELTLQNKTKLMTRLKHHVVMELRLSKVYFMSDHELIISFLDFTVDSSGLFTLVVLYQYHRMYWFLVILFEMILYPIASALLKQSSFWYVRNYVFLAINSFFGVITYFVNPHTEDVDKWFDFTGRVLLGLICIGMVIYASWHDGGSMNNGGGTLGVQNSAKEEEASAMYAPWQGVYYFLNVFFSSQLFTRMVILDLFMVVYFYGYVIYIMYSIGCFGVLNRMWKAMQFSFHDHVLDCLTETLDKRSFGLENVYTGLDLLVQWDDIIKSQRRYALLTWPDVRPPHLVSWTVKLFEIKWASFFNLTLNNIRSSLGLTILHTTMFQADSEVSKMIMFYNPTLLTIQDSQNDTPISIALKECAYYLMCYGEQKEGKLDDLTSYEDDDYATYYPEVDELRDEIYHHGEFVAEMSTEYYLTSEDILRLQQEGYYIEPSDPNYGQVYDDQGQRVTMEIPDDAVLPHQVTSKGQRVITYSEREQKRVLEQARKKDKQLQLKQKHDKQSLIQRRFPEDMDYLSYENGQSPSWIKIGYEIPNDNLFIDSHVMKRLATKGQKYHYTTFFARHSDVLQANRKLLFGNGFGNDADVDDTDDVEQQNRNRLQPTLEDEEEEEEVKSYAQSHDDDATSHKMSSHADKDVQYIVPGTKRVHLLEDDAMMVPLEHAAMSQYPDFDRKLKQRGRGSSRRASTNSEDLDQDVSGSNSRRKSVASNHSDNTLFTQVLKHASAESEHFIRYKVCKFAEILLSKEITDACKDLVWNVSDFKAFGRLASMNQGRIAQYLALVCHLNAPDGFVRLSDWSKGHMHEMYDERPEEDMPMLIKGIVTVVSKVEEALNKANDMVNVTQMTENFASKIASTMKKGTKGRSKRKRTTTSRSNNSSSNKLSAGHVDPEALKDGVLSDRIVQFLAEALVSSTQHLSLDDCELSYNARRAWRAISRALRQTACSFIIPSIFIPAYPICLLSLILSRNELDCGDCVYLADVLTTQKELTFVDISYNRIGGRGFGRLCKVLRDHPKIDTLLAHHNVIGPSTGHDLGIFLKQTTSLQVLDLHENHLGEIIRFPTLYNREKVASAAKTICLGLRFNKTLQQLDLSYNHLGVTLAHYLPLAINKHPCLHTLNISGNDLGAVHGSNLLFRLAGAPLGERFAREREKFISVIKQRQSDQLKEKHGLGKSNKIKLSEEDIAKEEIDLKDVMASITDSTAEGDDDDNNVLGNNASLLTSASNASKVASSPSKVTAATSAILPSSGDFDEASQQSSPSKLAAMHTQTKQTVLANTTTTLMDNIGQSFIEQLSKLTQPAMSLTSLSIADNSLGSFSGHAVAEFLTRVKTLTHLDLSGNSLGPIGGERITDELELLYKIRPREFLKIVLFEIEEAKYTGRFAKIRKKIFTNLISLNISRNNVGPRVLSGFSHILKSSRCGLVHLDIGENPVGLNTAVMAGNATEAALDLRLAMMENHSLTSINLRKTGLDPTNMVTMFGGFAHHLHLQELTLGEVKFDEPCCLQLGNILEHVPTIRYLDVHQCNMGANGGLIVAQKIAKLYHRISYLDISGNHMGPIAAIYIAEAIQQTKSKLRVLKLSGNDWMEDGGVFIAKALIGNIVAEHVDLSDNLLTARVGEYLADAARGLFKNGIKLRDSAVKKLILSNNPGIGFKSARFLLKALANGIVEYIDIRNINAGTRSADFISSALRDPMVTWRYLDISDNQISRYGMNQIFWGLRNNQKLRVLNIATNPVGSKFCSNADALLTHGISVPVMIRNNVVLRDLDLSYLSITSEAAVNILDAVIDNHTLKKLSLRGNLLDDVVALMLPDLLKCNNVLEELDLGRNRMGFACAYAIAESIETNRSLKRLYLDYNRFGGAGNATLDSFSRSLTMNYSLQVLVLDGNKLGPEWGIRLGETLARNNTLLQVSLRDNRLDSRAGKALLNAFKHCPYLLELAVTGDEIGEVLYDEFKNIFIQKRACINPELLVQETTVTTKQSQLLASYAK